MATSLKVYALPAICIVLGLQLTGCGIDENDVTAARDNVADEQRETQEVRADAQRTIKEKENELAESRHSAMRPNYDEKQAELDETKKAEMKKVREEERETQRAIAETKRLEEELAAKKSMEAYVADVSSKLESIDTEITSMREKLDGLEEGATRQELETNIELMEVKRENLNDALSELENAEVLKWKTLKSKVEQAIERFDSESAEDK